MSKGGNFEGRIDEVLAKEAIIDYCKIKSISFSHIERAPEIDGTKPDYVISFGDQKVLLEITQSGTGFYLNDSGIIEMSEYKKIISWESGLLKQVELWLPAGQTIILTINSPIKICNRSFMNKVNNRLKETFLNCSPTSSVDIQIDSFVYNASMTSYYEHKKEYSPLKTVYFPSASSPFQAEQNSLSAQAQYILVNRISSKEMKYGKVKLPKWLAIINVSPLLSMDDYYEAYESMKIQERLPLSSFDKIFIINEKIAYELK